MKIILFLILILFGRLSANLDYDNDQNPYKSYEIKKDNRTIISLLRKILYEIEKINEAIQPNIYHQTQLVESFSEKQASIQLTN
jgi:hypothetical protein